VAPKEKGDTACVAGDNASEYDLRIKSLIRRSAWIPYVFDHLSLEWLSGAFAAAPAPLHPNHVPRDPQAPRKEGVPGARAIAGEGPEADLLHDVTRGFGISYPATDERTQRRQARDEHLP
jgi:hypothetical protein